MEAERVTEQHQPKTVQQHLDDGASALASLLGYRQAYWLSQKHAALLAHVDFQGVAGVLTHPASTSSLFAYCRSHDEHSDEEHRDSPTAAMTENQVGLLHARSAGEEEGRTQLDDLNSAPTANGTADASIGVRMEGQDDASDNDDIDEQVIGTSCISH